MLRSLLKDTALYGVAGAASRLVGAIAVLLYIRIIPKAEYGLLELLLSTLNVAAIIAGLSLPSGVTRFYYDLKRQKRHHDLIRTATAAHVAFGLVCIAAYAAIFHYGVRGSGQVTWTHVLPFIAAILPTELLTLSLVLMRLERKALLFGVLSVGSVALTTVAGLIACTVFNAGAAGVVWAICGAKAVCVVIALARGDLFPAGRVDWPLAREVSLFSAPFVPAVLLNWAQAYGSRYVVAARGTLGDVAVLAFTTQLAVGLLLANEAFRGAWLPALMERLRESPEEMCRRTLDAYLAGVFPIAALTGALGGPVARIIAPPQYASAGDLLGFVAMSLLFMGASLVTGSGITISKKTYWSPVLYASGAAANIVLLWWLFPRFGLPVAVAAQLIGAVVIAAGALAIGSRLHPIDFHMCTFVTAGVLAFVTPVIFYVLRPSDSSLGALATATAMRLLVGAVAFGILWFFGLPAAERTAFTHVARETPRRFLLKMRGGRS